MPFNKGEVVMNCRFSICKMVVVIVLVFGFAAGSLQAEKNSEIPELIGEWMGESNAVVYGKLHHREAAEEVMFNSIAFTLVIKEQEGRVFHGIRFSEQYEEDIVGYIGLDNVSVYIVDHDGYMLGKLLPDGTLELGYLEAGKESRVASITHFKKM